MEEDSNKVAEIAAEMDKGIAGVMPDSWKGHGRLKIAERGFTGKKRTLAEKLLTRLSEKHPEMDAETLAEKCIDVAEQKF